MLFEPKPYQQYAIQRLVDSPRLGLFQEMGLGKTVETLTAIQILRLRWRVGRVLVVAPKKVAESTWDEEIAKWDHLSGMTISHVLGTQKQRVRALNTPADLWVINRENLVWLIGYYRNDWPFDGVVLDESTSFKNGRSKRFQAMKLVLGRIRWLVELTGTPRPNGDEDLWAQVYLLDQGERLGRTITSFRDAFFRKELRYRGADKKPYPEYQSLPGASDLIQDKIADICVSMKTEDYVDLPDYVEDIVPVKLGPADAEAYRTLEEKAVLQVADEVITAGTAAVLNGKLLQLCGGAVYGESGEVVQVHDAKLEALLETVERLGGQHALVFYWYQHERDRIRAALESHFPGLRVRIYKDDRDKRAWNAGEVDILLAHPASCGYGLNLQQGGHHMVWFTLPNWNLEIYQQACKRLHRQGQQFPVVSHILVVQGGMDQAVVAALQEKGDAQEALMQALKARIEEVKRGA